MSLENRLKQEKYQRKLLRLLDRADNLDATIVKNTERHIGQLRMEIIAKTTEAQVASSSGVEPKWGPYWAEKLRTSYNEVIGRLGDQFQKDLSEYTIQGVQNGIEIADKGLTEFAHGLIIPDNRIDPEQIKINASFSADLITGLKQGQLADINKQIALSMSMREGPAGLINRLSMPMDTKKGPWLSIKSRAESIAVTETSRVQELGRQLRQGQLARSNPTLVMYEQVLVAPINSYPCNRCAQYDGNVYYIDGRPYLIGKGKKDGRRPDYPIHPRCFPGNTLVRAGNIEAAYRRFYKGPMMEIFIEGSAKPIFSVTPNHPILSTNGFVAAGEIKPGDYLISGSFLENCPSSSSSNSNIDDPEVSIEEIFNSLSRSELVYGVSSSVMDFHGDGQEGEIEIVAADSSLRVKLESSGAQHISKFVFKLANNYPSIFSTLGSFVSGIIGSCAPGSFSSLLLGCSSGTNGIGFTLASSCYSSLHKHRLDTCPGDSKNFRNFEFGNSDLVKADNVFDLVCMLPWFNDREGFSVPSNLDSSLREAPLDSEFASTETFAETEYALPSQVSTHRVLKVREFTFSGHVYNLQTKQGFYGVSTNSLGESFISKNCRCTLIPWVPGYSEAPEIGPDREQHPEEVIIFWSTLYEAWVIQFHPSAMAPINTIRLPQNCQEETLLSAVYKLAVLQNIDPKTIKPKIEWPRDLNKASRTTERHVHRLTKLAKMNEQVADLQRRVEASRDSRWHNVARSYHSWRGMKDRCCNPGDKDYPRYGGRGIKICDAWLDDYEQFRKDMGEPKEGQTLDRIDNDGDYEPKNCRWASHKVQANNRS